MSYDVSQLENYVKQNADELIMSSVLGAKTASLIQAQGNVMLGVKSSQTINVMDTDVVFQAGGDCGWNSAGTTSVTQRTVSVGKIKVQEGLCPKKLEEKYLQNALPKGSHYEAIPFEADYTSRKVEKIKSAVETALWQGDTTSTDENLNKFDGFIKAINNATGVIEVTIAAAPSLSTIIDVLDSVYLAIPNKVVTAPDTAIVLGMDLFKLYVMALKKANMFHYTSDAKADSELTLPGTQMKVIALQGLNGTNQIYALRISNLHLATDLLNEEEKFDMWYDKSFDIVKFATEFKIGVNIAFPDEIVKVVID